jgi:hypothetical protein
MMCKFKATWKKSILWICFMFYYILFIIYMCILIFLLLLHFIDSHWIATQCECLLLFWAFTGDIVSAKSCVGLSINIIMVLQSRRFWERWLCFVLLLICVLFAACKRCRTMDRVACTWTELQTARCQESSTLTWRTPKTRM